MADLTADAKPDTSHVAAVSAPSVAPPRSRGRPPKSKEVPSGSGRPRGRPLKTVQAEALTAQPNGERRGRGRPRKVKQPAMAPKPTSHVAAVSAPYFAPARPRGRPRKSKEAPSDRFSSLPDELLCHILSFLTTKQAAVTSILSKRWRYLLAFVPYLNINDNEGLHYTKWRPEIVQSFMDFVDRILALQGNSPIKKCCLSWQQFFIPDGMDGWIHNVLVRGVSDLDLEIFLYFGNAYQLSPKFFQSRTLVKLKICFDIEIDWLAGSIFLPMLKTLAIHRARVSKFEILLDALPALEELVLDNVLWKDHSDWNVSSASLKTLTIKPGDCCEILSCDTPSLVYFEYYDCVKRDYPVIHMKNVVDARIFFRLTAQQLQQVREPDEDHWFTQDDALRFSNVWKLFHGVQNVSNLYMCYGTLEVLSLCCESMPVFKNLKSLAIKKSYEERGWQAMPILLRNCPHLETLVIEGLLHYETDKCGDVCDCISREDKGHSLASCPVKMLKIQGFQGTMKEMTMIKHFLVYFPCLKEMKIYVEEDDLKELRVPEKWKLIVQMMEDYNKLASCKVQLMVT